MDKFRFGFEYEVYLEAVNPLFSDMCVLYSQNKELEYELDLYKQGPKWNVSTKTIAPTWYKRAQRSLSETPAAGRKDPCYFMEHSMPRHALYCMQLNHLYYPDVEFALVAGFGQVCRQLPDRDGDGAASAWIRPMTWQQPGTDRSRRGSSSGSSGSSRRGSSKLGGKVQQQFWVISQDGSLGDRLVTGYVPPNTQATIAMYDTFASAASNKYEVIPVPSARAANVFGAEVISPIMSMKDIAYKVSNSRFDQVLRTALAAGGQFKQWHNDRTSNHVHLSYDTPGFFRKPAPLLKVCMAYWYFEPVLLLLCRHTRRANDYCWSLREFLTKGKVMSEGDYAMHVQYGNKMHLTAMSRVRFKEEYHKIFHTMRMSNYASVLKDLGLPDDYPSIVYMFQDFDYRTSALNLTNLVPNGSGTIEVRIKHGSTDCTENKMWMHLLANLFYSAFTDSRLVSERGGDRFRASAWDLYDQLAEHPHWTKSTAMHINAETASTLQDVLRVMSDYCPDRKVWSYWMDVLHSTHTICDAKSSAAACASASLGKSVPAKKKKAVKRKT
jgi:hypothetical protein